MNQETISKIRNRIAHGNLAEALEFALNVADEKFDQRNSLISLLKQYERLNEDIIKQIIDNDSYQSGTNKIMSNFLNILSEIESEINEESAFFDTLGDKDFEKYILEFISKGELNEAFKFLGKWLEKNKLSDSEFKDKFLLLSSRFNSNKNDERKGLLTNETIRTENSRTAKELVELVKQVNEAPQKEKQEKEKREQIESSAASFVQESITELNKREQKLKLQAFAWSLVGFLALIIGIGVAVMLVSTNEEQLKSTVGIIYLILKSLLIIGLLIAASRYAFNLGKTYMNESLKNADRIHAISFGKFYLQVFGANVKPDDLKDVFKDWNTIQESPFLKLDSSEFDPQLLQAFLKFAEVMKIGNK